MSDVDLLRAREEFLTDGAEYFADKRDVYLNLKEFIASNLLIPLSMIRVCGSAYWGRSFVGDRPFIQGESDLDVAVVDSMLFVGALSETRDVTKNFTYLTPFTSRVPNAPLLFQDYAYKKGMIRVDLLPPTKLRGTIELTANAASRRFRHHFSRVTIAIYDTELSFTVKQMNSTRKFRGVVS